MTMQGVGKVPDGWPTSVPVYPGAQITSSASTKSGKVVTLESGDAVEQVAGWYKSNLAGWTTSADAALGASHMMKLTSGGSTLQIVVNKAANGATHATLTVT